MLSVSPELISKIDEYVTCPPDFSNASFAYKIPDDAMEPMFKEGSYAFVEIKRKGSGKF